MDKKKILIIDNEQDMLLILKARLESSGYEAIMASNGKDGLRLAKKAKPNLILLDLLMPGMDGLQVLEQLKKDESTLGIPVIILSAKDDESLKTRTAELYDEMYLTKPVDGQILKAKIEEVFKRSGVA